MVRGPKGAAVCVRNPEGEIVCETHPVKSMSGLSRLPIVRGVAALGETMGQGMRAMIWSAQIAAGMEHILALNASGEVFARGQNTYGQCNVPADLGKCIAIRAAEHTSAAQKTDGTWVAWGWDRGNGVVDRINKVGKARNLRFRPAEGIAIWIE